MNTKWFLDLNVKHRTMKVIKDRTEVNQGDFGFEDKITAITPKACVMKEKIGKLDFIKI